MQLRNIQSIMARLRRTLWLVNPSAEVRMWGPMSYLSLRFCDDALEKGFWESHAANYLDPLDRCHIMVSLLTAPVIVMLVADRLGTSELIVEIICMSTLVMQAAILFGMKSTYRCHRGTIIVIFRCLFMLLGGYVALHLVKPASRTVDFFFNKLVCLGCVNAVWACVGMRLQHRTHLFLHTVLILSGAFLYQPFCKTVRHDTEQHAMMIDLWKNLQKVFNLTADIYLPLLPMESHMPECGCYSFSLIFQLMFSHILPSTYLYYQELRSRLSYLHSPAIGMKNAAAPFADLLPVWVRAYVAVALMAILLSLVWHLSNEALLYAEANWHLNELCKAV